MNTLSPGAIRAASQIQDAISEANASLREPCYIPGSQSIGEIIDRETGATVLLEQLRTALLWAEAQNGLLLKIGNPDVIAYVQNMKDAISRYS